MPSVVELDTVRTGFRLVSNSGSAVVDELTKDNIKTSFPPEYGRVYDLVRVRMGKRSVLDDASNNLKLKAADKGAPIQSPIVTALCILYAAHVGVIYVMCAPPGQGKTLGAEAFLQYFCQFYNEESVQGIMVTGQSIDGNYLSNLRDLLGVTNDEGSGWMHALLLALDERKGRQPSILILDGFNSLGKDNVNEAFIKTLAGLIAGKKNLFVVVMTSR